jgi:hypothetical protein
LFVAKHVVRFRRIPAWDIGGETFSKKVVVLGVEEGADRPRAAMVDTPGVTATENKIGNTFAYSGPASAYSVIAKLASLLASAGFRPPPERSGTRKGRNGRRTKNEISFHSLRHTAVSLLKDAGIPEAVDPHPGRYQLDPVSYMKTEEQAF